MSLKAYAISSINDWEPQSVIVWSETSNKAKQLGWKEFDDSEYIELRARRMPDMDGMQYDSEFKQNLYLLEECDWQLEYDRIYYSDEANVFIRDSALGETAKWYQKEALALMKERNIPWKLPEDEEEE